MSTDANAQAPPAKKKGKLPLILGAVGLLAAAGGGGYWFFLRPAQVAAGAEAEPTPEAAVGVVTFEPFVVNLADGEGARFLRISLRLVIPGEEKAAEVQGNAVEMVRLRSDLLDLLSEQTSDQLVTPEGKTALKIAIAERAAAVLNYEITDVLFSDFLVQF